MASFLFCSAGEAKIPNWAASNTTKQDGTSIQTVCNGQGPSVEIARSEALRACQVNASDFFKSKITIKSLSVETEKSIGFHQEIFSDNEYEGLICDPLRNELEEIDSHYSFWLECKFDLKKVKVRPKTVVSEPPDSAGNLNSLESISVTHKKHYQSKFLIISTLPKCESLLITGATSRVIECTSNPVKVILEKNDKEIIVRAKNYKPKKINLRKTNENETIQVILDLL